MFNSSPLRSSVTIPLNHLMISPRGDIPVPPPPYELLGLISTTEWDERVRSLLVHLQCTTWSLWLRLYVLFGIVLSSGLPWPIIIVVQRAIIGNSSAPINFDGPIFDQEREAVLSVDPDYAYRVSKARYAAGGILLGILMLVWSPLLIYLSWKSSQLSTLLQSFTTNDSLKGRSQSLTWSLLRIRFITRTAQLVITLPSSSKAASNYHPEAYLPPYIARASGDSMHKRNPSSGSGKGSDQGSWGRQRPERRERFDYRNMAGAPVPSYQLGAGGRV